MPKHYKIAITYLSIFLDSNFTFRPNKDSASLAVQIFYYLSLLIIKQIF